MRVFLLFLAIGYYGSSLAASVSELAWLEGKWEGNSPYGKIIEQFSGTSGGIILGTMKILKGNDLQFFEFMRIESKNNKVVLKPMPFAKPGITLVATKVRGQVVRFQNLENDFPKVIEFTRAGQELSVLVSGTRDGQPSELKYVLTQTNLKGSQMQVEKSNQSPIQNLSFMLIYADDLSASLEFYKTYFNFVEDPEVSMGEDQVFGHIGPVGIWIGGGFKHRKQEEEDVRATVMLAAHSAPQLFSQLAKGGISMIQEQPIQMSEDRYWFQFRDPSGNILEVLGGK